jgi:hypothetical protein
MISSWFADVVLFASLVVSLVAYVVVSRHDSSYFNVMSPLYIIHIPAYYFLPLFFNHVFGVGATSFAYIYVYATVAVENVAFAYAYTRGTRNIIRLPFRYAYNGFEGLSFIFLALSVLMYAPILLQFPEYLLDPRQIYQHTRTGFGVNFYLSSTLAYLAVILILCSKRSLWVKGFVFLVAGVILSLHGAKGQVLSLILLVALYQVYVRRKKIKLLLSLITAAGLGVLILLLFAASQALGDSPAEILESISQYSDYTRNAMLVIDSHFPRQYGRLTLEAQIIGRIPRVLWPGKPKNFGGLYLDEQFFPEALDEDIGAPDFGMGIEYADFGVFAIVYLAGMALLRGWLARVFVRRLGYFNHPADFFIVGILAGLSLFPVGGVGWFLPEALIVAFALRFASCLGADTVYRERVRTKRTALPSFSQSGNPAESV